MTSDHVSLASAKRLQESGWKEETEKVYWFNGVEWQLTNFVALCIDNFPEKELPECIPAPSTAQLADWLPAVLHHKNLTVHKRGGTYANGEPRKKRGYSVSYGASTTLVEADSLPDALASMACYLLENGLMPKK